MEVAYHAGYARAGVPIYNEGIQQKSQRNNSMWLNLFLMCVKL